MLFYDQYLALHYCNLSLHEANFIILLLVLAEKLHSSNIPTESAIVCY